MGRITALLVAVAFSSGAVVARAESGAIPVFAFEDSSCGAWASSARDAQTRELYLFWFRGFVSGYNHGSNKKEVPLDTMPNQETLALYIDKYCKDNPLKPFVGAAMALVKEIAVRTQ